MRHRAGYSRRWLYVAVMFGLSACGSGNNAVAPPANDDPGQGGNDPATPIEGVATPSTVSVVTATNAD
jgi:hypothetical protein